MMQKNIRQDDAFRSSASSLTEFRIFVAEVPHLRKRPSGITEHVENYFFTNIINFNH
jgi:hypothetical protein